MNIKIVLVCSVLLLGCGCREDKAQLPPPYNPDYEPLVWNADLTPAMRHAILACRDKGKRLTSFSEYSSIESVSYYCSEVKSK